MTRRPLGGLVLTIAAFAVIGVATVVLVAPTATESSTSVRSDGIGCRTSGVSSIVSVEALDEINVFRCPTRSLQIRFPTGATASILQTDTVIGPQDAGGSGTLVVSAEEFYRWQIDSEGWVVAWRPGQDEWWSEWWGDESAVDRVRTAIGDR